MVLEDVELPGDLSDVKVVSMDVLDDCDELCVDEDLEVAAVYEDDVLVDADEIKLVEDELEEDWLLEDVELIPPVVTEPDEVEEVDEDVPAEVDIDADVEVDVPALIVEVLDPDVVVTTGATPMYLAPRTPFFVA